MFEEGKKYSWIQNKNRITGFPTAVYVRRKEVQKYCEEKLQGFDLHLFE